MNKLDESQMSSFKNEVYVNMLEFVKLGDEFGDILETVIESALPLDYDQRDFNMMYSYLVENKEEIILNAMKTKLYETFVNWMNEYHLESKYKSIASMYVRWYFHEHSDYYAVMDDAEKAIKDTIKAFLSPWRYALYYSQCFKVIE